MQFQIRYYRSDMAEYRRRQPREMSDIERVETIARLRRHGWSYAKIGEVVGLSANGVMHALRRATQPERYRERFEEEVDPVGVPAEEW